MKPLQGMCDFQLKHGAVVHQSKEYLMENGLYKKQALRPTDKVGRSRPRRRAKQTVEEQATDEGEESKCDHVSCDGLSSWYISEIVHL